MTTRNTVSRQLETSKLSGVNRSIDFIGGASQSNSGPYNSVSKSMSIQIKNKAELKAAPRPLTAIALQLKASRQSKDQFQPYCIVEERR